MAWGERFTNAITSLAAGWISRQLGGGVFVPHNNYSNFYAGLGSRYDNALALSAVYACIRILAQDMAKMQLGAYERLDNGSTVYAANHPLNRLFRRPNKHQTSFQWVQAKIADIATHGNSFDRIVWADNGWPVGLVPYRPTQVSVRQDVNDGEMFYRLPQSTDWLNSSQILHLRGLSVDGAMGLSPLAAARKAIDLGLTLEQHGLNLFKRGARPGGVVSVKKALHDKPKANLRAQIEAFVGGEASGGIMLLEEDSTFEALTMTSTDAEFLVNRRFQLEEVCRMYGVPLHRVAEMIKATYNNAEMVAADYVNNTLMAYAENIEASLDRWLIGDTDRFYTQFDTASLLRADQASRFKSYQTGITGGFLSPNEARRAEARFSTDPLPPYPLGNRFYVASNTVPVELAGQQPAGGDKPKDDDKPAKSADEEEEE